MKKITKKDMNIILLHKKLITYSQFSN